MGFWKKYLACNFCPFCHKGLKYESLPGNDCVMTAQRYRDKSDIKIKCKKWYKSPAEILWNTDFAI